MRPLCVMAAALLTSSVHAANTNEQACILKVADTLPKIAGMKIGESRTSPAGAPAPAGWLRVDIDWSAAG